MICLRCDAFHVTNNSPVIVHVKMMPQWGWDQIASVFFVFLKGAQRWTGSSHLCCAVWNFFHLLGN